MMLVLSRRLGESIQISDDITVTVSQVRGGRVRLSISAPSDVRVLRKEIVSSTPTPCDEEPQPHP